MVMNGYGGSRKHYQFEVIELDFQFALQAIEMEGGPGGAVSDFCDSVCGAVSDLWDNATDFMSDTFDILSDPMSIFEDPFGTVTDLFDITMDFVEDTVEDIEDIVEEAWETVENAWDSVCEFCSDAWDTVCDVWDDWGKQIIGVVAVVACSWIPGVNAVVAAAVIGALQAGLESGWDLQAMAVGAAAGAISQGCGGSLYARAAVGALKSGSQNGWDLEAMAVGAASGALSGGKGGGTMLGKAASGALKAGYASDWDVSEMGEGALASAATSYIDGKLDMDDQGIMGSKLAGEVVEEVIKDTTESCARNGFNQDAVVSGIASGVGDSLGRAAATNIETDSDQAKGLMNTAVSSATYSAIVATANGDDVGAAVIDGLKQDTVRFAARELADQAYNELPEDQAGQLIERQCSMVTNAVADAAASVTVGGDFGDTFKNEFNDYLIAEAETIKEGLKNKEKNINTKINNSSYETDGSMPNQDPLSDLGIYGLFNGLPVANRFNPETDLENTNNSEELPPEFKVILDKAKNGEKINEEEAEAAKDVFIEEAKKLGKEFYDKKLKSDVDKNWEEFKKDPIEYIEENPWKSAGALATAGAAGGYIYKLYDDIQNGEKFDYNLGLDTLGISDETFKLTDTIGGSLKGEVGYRREVKNGDADLYLNTKGELNYEKDGFNIGAKIEIKDSLIDSLSLDGTKENGGLYVNWKKNENEKDVTNIGANWTFDNNTKIDLIGEITNNELSAIGAKMENEGVRAYYENDGNETKVGIDLKYEF
jgi:ElaB/YqjD/DUF883 family membrane-anchored ribosome-binding protein